MLDKVKRLKEDVRASTRERPASTIVVTCISAIGTIIVAGIGIVPAILNRNATIVDRNATIADLSKQIDDLKKQIEQKVQDQGPPYSIQGRVRSVSNHKPVTDAQLYLADAANQATVDDTGSFLVQNMFQKDYWLVLAQSNGKIQRLLIKPQDPAGETADVDISWSFVKQ
jgi:hypothetical protein